jgi:VanZ family protein
MPTTRWLRSWLPALCWAGVIWALSTSSFSAEHTASFLAPGLRWLYPAITPEQIATIHFLIRKTAHFTEYFVFSLLLFRGRRGEEEGWRWTWALSAFALAAVSAMLDEVHQSFVEGRTASVSDAVLDSAGALAAMICSWMWMRLRPRPAPHA